MLREKREERKRNIEIGTQQKQWQREGEGVIKKKRCTEKQSETR